MLLLLSYIYIIYIYTYAKLLTFIVYLRSLFTGVKQLLWFIWKIIYIHTIYIYGIMKTMCPPSYHHHGFVPKCMSCHKAIVVITGRAHCFHDYIYIALILILWDLSTLCVVDHLWPLIYIHIIYMHIYIYMFFSNCLC